MKRILLSGIVLSLAFSCAGQLGLVGGYQTFYPEDWNKLETDLGTSPYPISGYHAGIDYWFRLKKRRIEFTPELYYAKFETSLEEGELKHSVVGFQFNTDFYVFDMASDCNCPTFSKEGSFISRGFFIELAPSLFLLKNEITTFNGVGTIDLEESKASFGGVIGAGLDLGFTDLFTVTPIARFYFHPNVSWEDGFKDSGLQSDLKQLFLGLRVRLHFKEFANARFH